MPGSQPAARGQPAKVMRPTLVVAGALRRVGKTAMRSKVPPSRSIRSISIRPDPGGTSHPRPEPQSG